MQLSLPAQLLKIKFEIDFTRYKSKKRWKTKIPAMGITGILRLGKLSKIFNHLRFVSDYKTPGYCTWLRDELLKKRFALNFISCSN
jgi:hypothetical protein